jgi:hypothetical protein
MGRIKPNKNCMQLPNFSRYRLRPNSREKVAANCTAYLPLTGELISAF